MYGGMRMRIHKGIEMLDISAAVLGKKDTVHPTLIWDEERAVLIDTGYPGQLPLFLEAFQKADVPLEKLRNIIITHQDLDHIGSLPAILEHAPTEIEVLTTELEKPYIEGKKRILKLTPEAIAQVDSMIPPNVPEDWVKAFKAVLNNPPKGRVDRTIKDGEFLPYGYGIQVVFTPGHTPGHTSLYHLESKTLIAGDALVIIDGVLHPPDSQQTLDMEEAIRSLQKLTVLDIQQVICYHGGLYSGDVNKRLNKFSCKKPVSKGLV